MRKICIISGHRSDYGRLKPVIQAVKDHPDLESIFIVAASHLLPDQGKTIDTIKEDGLQIDSVARTIVEGEDLVAMAKSVGLGILELPTILENYTPDVVVVHGDRFEALSVAISAAMMNIPVAHIQGGEVTGSIDESIRHAITKMAHIHFPSTDKSRERIFKMGERPESVFTVGSPAIDAIRAVINRPKEELYRKYKLDPNSPFLIMAQHPVTTEFNRLREEISETLRAIYELKIRTIMIFPNIDAGSKDMVAKIRHFEMSYHLPFVNKYKHIHFDDFIGLMSFCACMAGNSSAGIIESSYIGTPVVNIGTRQNGRERGKNVIDVGYNSNEIIEAIKRNVQHGRFPSESIYGDGNSSKKIADILASCDLSCIQKKIAY